MQSANPVLHSSRHTPAVHVADRAFAPTRQGLLHAPQWLVLVLTLVSHESGFMSQSANPTLHDARVHAPPVHAAVPFMTMHALPHAPQLLVVLIAVSQPLRAPSAVALSQSANPVLHAVHTHLPPMHCPPLAFADVHAKRTPPGLSQPPQLVVLVFVFTQVLPQIVSPAPVQFGGAAAHSKKPVVVSRQICPATQRKPHPRQLDVVLSCVSQPSAGSSIEQSPNPTLHA